MTLIPGDGTGPELAEATRRVLEATGVEFDWDEQPAGEDVYAEEGTPFPDRTLDSIKRNRRRHQGTDHHAGRLGLPLASTCCCARSSTSTPASAPARPTTGVRTRFPETDIVIVRENTEDLYAGIEFEKDSRRGRGPARASCEELDARAHPRGLRHLDQADLGLRLASASCAVGLRLRQGERPQEGHRGPQGQHHEVLRRPVPGGRAQGGRGLPGHRVRGPHHRQPVQPARVAARGVRRDRAAQPLRRHRLRPRRRHDRRPRASRPAPTSAPRRRCSRPRTARRPSTRARTRSTRRR